MRTKRRSSIVSVIVLVAAFGAGLGTVTGGCAVGQDEGGADAPRDAAGDGRRSLPDGGEDDDDDDDDTPDARARDAGNDADAVDLGPPGPVGPPTGTACSKAGEAFELTCGQCGVQVAICSDGKVGPYGPCRNEKLGPDNCIPGVSSRPTCGFCGTKTRACRNDCTWTETTCHGERTDPDRCMPGVTQRRLADCNDGEARTYTCAADCAWAAPSPCAPNP